MKTIVSGRNIQLTQAIKDYVTEKAERLGAHFDFILEVHVFLSVAKNPSVSQGHEADATIHVNGAVVRVTAHSDNLYASIDSLMDKTHRSLAKYKTKLLHRAKSGHGIKGESFRRQAADEVMADVGGVAPTDEDLGQLYLTYGELDEEDASLAAAALANKGDVDPASLSSTVSK
jgi:ribosomal subunit interface protein